jgi:sarcosine oxidase/L-pipecolate oxidase
VSLGRGITPTSAERLTLVYCSAFKFLPILGEYVVKGWKHQLPEDLAKKWRFKTEHANDPDVFKGDGSRGGPERRELTAAERKVE